MQRTSAILTSTALLCLALVPFAPARAQYAHAAATTGDATVKQAVALLAPASGSNCRGTIRFMQVGDAVQVVVDVEGLNPGQQHAMHVHEFGDCTAPDASTAGSHYNPEGHPHGLPATDARHAGDLGNLQADKDGKAHYEITVTNMSIAGPKNPILGRAVIVHAKLDDGGQPVGNAGPRIACGVIGIAKPSESK